MKHLSNKTQFVFVGCHVLDQQKWNFEVDNLAFFFYKQISGMCSVPFKLAEEHNFAMLIAKNLFRYLSRVSRNNIFSFAQSSENG